MQTVVPNVVLTRDGGYDCYDTTVTAREIARAFTHGLLAVDSSRQRGRNNVTGKAVLKKEKIERWARELQEDKAIFGQLTWNFRPEEADLHFAADPADENRGQLIIREGSAYLPDSVHRHEAIRLAVDSVASGSSFDPARRFSLRIWCVPQEFENAIFYAMNVEHDKADASRSKWLAQKNVGQELAARVVRTSPHLGEGNVETVSNNLSVRNHRLAAFNTFSNGFEESWADISPEKLDAATEWFVAYWERLVEVLPFLRRLSLPERQAARRDSLGSWAIAIHGYIRVARLFYDNALDLSLLERLAAVEAADDFFSWTSPEWQQRGIVVSGVNKSGKSTINVRNSYQTRRAMAEALLQRLGLEPGARA